MRLEGWEKEGQEKLGRSRENVQRITETTMKSYINESGAGGNDSVAQCLLCKHEDLSSDLEHLCEKLLAAETGGFLELPDLPL